MYLKIAIIGGTAAAIIGVGTAALATTGDSSSGSSGTTAGSGSSSTVPSLATESAALTKFARRHPLLARELRDHVVHGQIVTKDGSTFVTHDGILGTVSAVSTTSITVKASDGYVETFTVGSSTKVRTRSDGKGSKSAIGDVHTGDEVAVIGKGATDPTATVIVDIQGATAN